MRREGRSGARALLLALRVRAQAAPSPPRATQPLATAVLAAALFTQLAPLPMAADDPIVTGDALAARGAYNEALLHWKRGIEPRLERLRGLAFARPVRAEVLERSRLRALLLEELDAEMPPAERARLAKTLVALGLLDPGI
ncbi:MAG: hypothetical protein ACE5GW_10115, partial [Planctomycetota bacterium]